MTNIPDGWRATTLGELGRYLNGRAFKKQEWGTAGRPIIRIQNLTGSSSTFNYFEGELEDRYVVRAGDLLVSWAATLGSYFWNGPQAVLNQHIFKVESNIDPRFHKYLLDHKLAELMRHTHGSGMVHITRGRFDSLPVVVPPINEQRRVVAILEDHLSRLDAADAYLTSSERRVEAWRSAATQRELWIGDPVERPVGELLREPMRNGRSDRAVKESEAGTRTLTLTAVTRNQFTDEFTKLTVTPQKIAQGLWLEPGDVLVQRSNTPELVGTAARYDGPKDWAIFPDLLIRLRPDESVIDGRFFVAALRSEKVHRTLRSRAKGLAGSMPKIDQRSIAEMAVPVPSLSRQRGAVERITEIERSAAAAVAQIARQRLRAGGLRSALLAAAFSGRLTGSAKDLSAVEKVLSA